MTLIIENGTGVSDAQSYVTVASAKTFAATRSITLSTDDSILESQLELAAVKLEEFGPYKTDQQFPGIQRFEWPRTGSPGIIPGGIKNAQMLVVFDAIAESGVDFTVLPDIEYTRSKATLRPFIATE